MWYIVSQGVPFPAPTIHVGSVGDVLNAGSMAGLRAEEFGQTWIATEAADSDEALRYTQAYEVRHVPLEDLLFAAMVRRAGSARTEEACAQAMQTID